MRLTFPAKPSKDAILIYPVFKKMQVKNVRLARILKKLADSKEFEAKEGQTFAFYNAIKNFPQHTILLGMGKKEKTETASVMSAFGVALKAAKKHSPKNVAVMLTCPCLEKFSQAIAESVVLANYEPAIKYKTGEALKKIQQKYAINLEIVGASQDKTVRAAFKKGAAIAEVVNDLRDWVNAPPNFANTEYFVARAREIAKMSGAEIKVLHGKELKKLGMNALLAVNRGSAEEARMIILDFKPRGTERDAPIVFVGKGIIFDSGGYNLKPSGHIEDMHLDKAGAASVLSLIQLAAKIGLRKRIIAIAPCTENLIGPHALKPSEIIKSYSGKTIEITNTDAEGRLILADAVAYAVKKFKPKFLVDMATLTGACVVALGYRYAGLFGNDKNLIERIREAGDEVDDSFWPLPIHKDIRGQLKGNLADLRNSSDKKYAGAARGAAFIEEFVGKTKWLHLDIAGPAYTPDPKKYESKGATGFGLRALLRFLEKF